MKNITPILILVTTVILSLSFLRGNEQFIYTFLSDAYALHLYALALLFLLFFGQVFQAKIIVNRISYQLVIFLTWGVYVILYCLLSNNCEVYYYSYLLLALLIALSIAYFIRYNQLKPVFLYIPIALLGFSESIVALLQYLQILSSNSSNFPVTGTIDNPNIAAMIICLSIPSWIEITQKFKHTYRYFAIIILVLIMASLLILQCRTALIGTIVIGGIYALKFMRNSLVSKFCTLKIAFIIALIVLIGAVSIIQHKKQASFDGRITIWKVTSEMIVNKPFSGYGYGLFQREYNLQQADYFNSEMRAESERMNAGYTAMGYNEYLQHTVMGGLLGGLLFTAVIMSLMLAGWKGRDITLTPFASIAAYAVMSLFNFTVESPILFFIFITYSAVTLSYNGSGKSIKTFVLDKKITLLCSLIGLVFVFVSLRKYEAQKELTIANKQLQNGQIRQVGELLRKIEPDISTSEAFYRTKASWFIINRDFENALKATKQALNYTSVPATLLIAAQLSEKLGDNKSAEKDYLLACGIEPHMMRPRVMLMKMYQQTGQIAKSKTMAGNLLSMKPKFDTNEVRVYKKMAQDIKNTNTPRK